MDWKERLRFMAEGAAVALKEQVERRETINPQAFVVGERAHVVAPLSPPEQRLEILRALVQGVNAVGFVITYDGVNTMLSAEPCEACAGNTTGIIDDARACGVCRGTGKRLVSRRDAVFTILVMRNGFEEWTVREYERIGQEVRWFPSKVLPGSGRVTEYASVWQAARPQRVH